MVLLVFSSAAASAQPIDIDVEFDDVTDNNLTDLVDPKDLESSDSKFTVTLLNDDLEGNVASSSPVFDLLRVSNFSLQSNVSDNALELAAKKKPSRCGRGNPMDDCWQCDPYWHKHRQNLAFCAIGFGRNAIGGLNGATYIVTDPGNDNPTDPRPGTLRWAVVQERPMWIIFARDMTIRLKQELIMTSYKTIDGRGVNVHIAYGACITLQRVHHVIIHGVHIHHCKSTGPARVRSSSSHVGKRGKTDGDGISIISSSNIWIDHNSLSRCTDGLIDAIHGSDLITISNNYFSNHDKVMLFGASDGDGSEDKIMQITVTMNYFGPKLCQRMPR
ncbi:hypothetical protein Mapa_011273 [Marchantia paleacea]|nr:hypothetical protein Mapa_011273 [Marchantia paleacea]